MEMLSQCYAWYVVHRGPFEVVALVLSFLGIAFALMSIQDGRKLTRDLRAVFDHLTTRALGNFPSYMAEVERLIEEARESVFVACDFPGYGVFTDRGRYGSYLKALETRKADRVRRGRPFDVQVLCLDAAGRENRLQESFPEGRWKEFIKKGSFAKSRRLYEELENARLPDTRTGFVAEMIERQRRALEADLRFAERWEHAGTMPIHLWIADGEKAVFAIPSFGEDLAEYGFVTEEAGLVQSLMSIWLRYLEGALRVEAAGGPRALAKAR